MNVGVLGGGQLGRMLALAGYPLGLRFHIYDTVPEAPAEHVADFTQGAFEDETRLAAFIAGLDVITYEFENVPVAAAEFVARHVMLWPSARALSICQDRRFEKEFISDCQIPTAPYAVIGTAAEIVPAADRIGYPCVLKSRRMGYDGKGQAILRSAADAAAAWTSIGAAPAIVEQFISFDRELSLIAVRGATGEIAFYPLVQNIHRDGILRETLAPAPQLDQALQAQAEQFARRMLETLEYVGVLAIEFFEYRGGLFVNELAPRVHNSGHWTIEGAATSQFENHLRAILGWPLGPTSAISRSHMFNLVGQAPETPELLAIPGAHVHFYGKSPRPGRKIGHVTLWGVHDEMDERIRLLRERIHRLE